jgi:hypothetical protein
MDAVAWKKKDRASFLTGALKLGDGSPYPAQAEIFDLHELFDTILGALAAKARFLDATEGRHVSGN